jgi:tetratricopeptide (TPR) repeat protein
MDYMVADQSHSFDNVFWVDVGNQQAAEQGFMNISDLLKLQAQSFQQVVQFLSGTQQTWLLVLDNADDPATDFHPFFPSGSRGTVIMTSRNPECGQVYGYDHWEKLDVLEDSLARDLLLRVAGYEPSPAGCEHADEIVKVLGSHTLAVVLAGSYIARHRNLDKYLHVYEKHWTRIVQHAPKQERSRYGSVNATFEASVSILEGENSETSHDALQLLQILSTLAASNVPLSLFEEAWSGIGRVPNIDQVDDLDGVSDWHVSRLPKFLRSTASEWNPYRLVEACNTLETLAIITTSDVGNSGKLSMHPLLHDWIWRRQTIQQMEVSWAMAGSVIVLACRSNEAWFKHGTDYRSSLGSYISTWRKYKLFPSPEFKVLQIVHCCAISLHQARSDQLALSCLDEIVRTQYGDGKGSIAQPIDFKKLLAQSRLHNGDVVGSIMLWEEAIRIQSSLAEEHPDRLASQHELAIAYRANGQVGKAVGLLEHVVKVKQSSLVEDHPDRLASQHELAIVYRADGQVGKAVGLLEHVVKVREGSLAEDHPSRLASQHELAGAYRANGQVGKAVGLLEHVVKIQEGSLAEDHPDRLASQHALAGAYQANGQVYKAVGLLEHVVKIQEGSLTEDHPDRLASQHALAGALRADGQVHKAVGLLEHVLKVRESSLAEDHPSRLASQHALAGAYQANRQVGKAIDLLEHVIRVKQGSLVEDHPSRLTSQHALAIAYRADGQVCKAVGLLEHVVKVREGSLAEDHPSRLASQHALAIAYRADGQVGKAVGQLEHVVKVREGSLAEDHPSRLVSQYALAGAYQENGQVGKAVGLLEHVVKVREVSLAEVHPDRLASQRALSQINHKDQ